MRLLNKTLLRKSIHEARWLWCLCALILFVFCWIHVTVTSQIEMGKFAALLKELPEYMQSLFPVEITRLLSYPARVALTYEEPLVYMLMTIWSVTRSSDVVSGELGRGTMEMILAQPVSRLQVFFTPVLVTLCGIVMLAAVAWAGTTVGITSNTVERQNYGRFSIPFTRLGIPRSKPNEPAIQVPMSRMVNGRQMIPAALNYLAFGVCIAGVCSAISAFDRYRWRTIGIMMSFFVVQMLAELLGNAFDSLRWVKCLTFFRAYEPIMFVSESVEKPQVGWSWFIRDAAGSVVDIGPLTGDAILLFIGALGLVVAGVWFCHRDLPAPL